MCISLTIAQDTPFIFATASTIDGGPYITQQILTSLALTNLRNRTVSIIHHHYTEGLVPLVESLLCKQACVHFYGFQPEANSAEESILHLCRALLSSRNIHLKDPAQHSSPADLIFTGQLLGTIIITNADHIGIVLALKSIGDSCPMLDADISITSPITTSLMGQVLREMCAEIPPLGAKNHAEAFKEVVTTFAIALQGRETGIPHLDTARGFHPEM